MIVDSHFHAWSPASSLAADRAYAPAAATTIEDALVMQVRHGVDHAVMIQPSFLGTDNSYILVVGQFEIPSRSLSDFGIRQTRQA